MTKLTLAMELTKSQFSRQNSRMYTSLLSVFICSLVSLYFVSGTLRANSFRSGVDRASTTHAFAGVGNNYTFGQ